MQDSLATAARLLVVCAVLIVSIGTVSVNGVPVPQSEYPQASYDPNVYAQEAVPNGYAQEAVPNGYVQEAAPNDYVQEAAPNGYAQEVAPNNYVAPEAVPNGYVQEAAPAYWPQPAVVEPAPVVPAVFDPNVAQPVLMQATPVVWVTDPNAVQDPPMVQPFQAPPNVVVSGNAAAAPPQEFQLSGVASPEVSAAIHFLDQKPSVKTFADRLRTAGDTVSMAVHRIASWVPTLPRLPHNTKHSQVDEAWWSPEGSGMRQQQGDG